MQGGDRSTASTHGSLRPHVSADRLKQLLAEFGKIGRSQSGGLYREALTDADLTARRNLLQQAQARGFSTSCDPIGNLFIRLNGRKCRLPAVMTGSHLDTQPDGGAFDGALGVLAGFEALCAIQETMASLERSIEVAVWMNEEGSRFMPGCMGSRAFVTPNLLSDYLQIADDAGVTVGQELARSEADLLGTVNRVDCARDVHCFVELHIEQGPILETNHRTIGIVEGIQGYRRYKVTITGKPAHSGTSPRHARKDALLSATKIINELAGRLTDSGDELRFTVGKVAVYPNSMFIVPARFEFWVDIRHPKEEVLAESDQILRDICARPSLGCKSEIDSLARMAPIRFGPEVIDSIAAAVERQGLSHMRIFSGAGHDAQNLHLVCPTGMIFIPCKDGISHSPKEQIEFDDALAGTQLLTEVLVEWAQS